MKRRMFLSGLFATPIAAFASSNINNIIPEDKEVILSVDYDYTNYGKIKYDVLHKNVILPLIDKFIDQATERGMLIGESYGSNTHFIDLMVEEKFDSTIENGIYRIFTPKENAKGTMHITLEPALSRTFAKSKS